MSKWIWPLPGITPNITIDSPGAFGARRKYDIHTGVDLYCDTGQSVVAVEPGEVANVVWFTGVQAESPWWLPTHAVLIEGESGVVCYGEISTELVVGDRVEAGEEIGKVERVLRHYKGLPTTMLHLELYVSGTVEPIWWRLGEECPSELLDPTGLLMESEYV